MRCHTVHAVPIRGSFTHSLHTRAEALPVKRLNMLIDFSCFGTMPPTPSLSFLVTFVSGVLWLWSSGFKAAVWAVALCCLPTVALFDAFQYTL